MNNEVENRGGSTETPTNEEPKKGWRKMLERALNWLSHKDNKNRLNEMRGNLSLIATVIATMTFQMALNPPGGVIPIKDDANPPGANANPPGANANPPDFNANPPGGDINPDIYCIEYIVYGKFMYRCPGDAVLAIVRPDEYFQFLVSNTICFIASLSICLLLVSGIRFNHRFPMWLLSIGMCITLTSLALSYITALQMTTSDPVFEKANKFLGKLVFAWMGLLAIVALYHTLRLVVWGINFFLKKMAKTQKITKETPVC